MNAANIKPIPKYVERKIRALDRKCCPKQQGLRFYAYLTTVGGELVKITVAVRNKGKRLQLMKQVAVHGVRSDHCLVRDMEYNCIGVSAYRVGWYDEGVRYRYGMRPWYNDGIWYPAGFKYYNPCAIEINPEYPLKLPAFRYSAIDRFRPRCTVSYLRTYLKYPQAEYLVTFGLEKFLRSRMILQRIGKDKKFCKWLIANNDELRAHCFYIDVILRAYTTGKPLRQLQVYRQAKLRLHKDRGLDVIRAAFTGKDRERLFDYLSAQQTDPRTYLDYYNACLYLGLDMTKDKNRFPHDFKRWHDIRTDQYATAKALKDEAERKELYLQFAAVAEKYRTLQHDRKSAFLALIPRSPADLIREGECLNHCVGRMNYDLRIIREESLIVLIRHRDQPDTPFVTVEYSPAQRRILQCYGEHNRKPDDAVLHYVHRVWLPYANRAIKRIISAA